MKSTSEALNVHQRHGVACVRFAVYMQARSRVLWRVPVFDIRFIVSAGLENV